MTVRVSQSLGMRSRSVLGAAVLVYWLIHTLMRPLVGPYSIAAGMEPHQVGFILSGYAISALVLAIPSGALGDRIGHSRLLAYGGLAMALGGGLFALANGLWPMFLSQLIIGAGSLWAWLAIQALMTFPGGRNPSSLNRQIANYAVLVVLGQVLGPSVGGIVTDLAGYGTAFICFVGGGVFLGIAGVGLTTEQPTHARPTSPRGGAPQGQRLMQQPHLFSTMAISFFGLYIADIRLAFVPVLLSERGLSLSLVGLLLSLSSLFAAMARPILPWALDRFKVGLVAVASLTLAAISIGLVALAGPIWAVGGLLAVAGVGIGMVQPLTLSLIALLTDERHRGVAIGARLVANRMAQLINPVLTGSMMGVVGIAPAILGTCLVLSVLTLPLGTSMRFFAGSRSTETR